MSGGVDSATAAYLLKKEHFQVIGLHADFGFSPESPLPWLEKICSFLGIPLEIVSLKESFKQKVVDYFVDEYKSGRTPNPCVVCNPLIKFDLLYQKGIHLGADFFATGHYARIVPAFWGEGLTVARGVDREKDQSYFLHRLDTRKLNRIIFPLGAWRKDQVKELAGELKMPVPLKGESQDICFLPKGGYREFLRERIPSEFIRPGDITDTHGKKLGTHQGLFAFTVGQRKGLGIPAAEPYYVVRLEPQQNRLVIGGKKDLESTGCLLSDFHFLCPPDQIEGLEFLVQVRYRHKPGHGNIKIIDDQVELSFDTPQKAVTPGQAVVLYREDQVVGGGWIEKTRQK